MENNRQEKMIEMIKDFTQLSKENQVYVSGIIKGFSIQKEFSKETHEKESA
jgi:hypothetical protein